MNAGTGVGVGVSLAWVGRAEAGEPVADTNNLLLEGGDNVLLESGDFLLLEA